MADPAPAPNPALAMGKTVAKFVAAWGLVSFAARSQTLEQADRWIRVAIYKILAGFPAAAETTERAFSALERIFCWSYFATLVFATGLAALGAAARMVARARVRAGQADYLDRLRAWRAAHPNAMRALYATPGFLWTLILFMPGPYERHHLAQWLGEVSRGAAPDALAVWGMYTMAKKGVGELLAPTIGGTTQQATFEISPNEIAFDAVAVTRRTLALVGVFTAITLAVPLYIATRPLIELFHDRSLFVIAFGYIAFAGAGATAFRKASRVAVGVDGVHVYGTSKARFFAYRDIDSARVKGSDIEIVRRGKVILRLQLHGEDAARRDAVLARITENLAHVKEGRGAVAAQLVASSTKDALARVAQGAADYRMATLTREQLWALVEGPEIEASARKAAAEALVAVNDERERARLRVAAEHCAEPHVRVALQELAAADATVNDDPARKVRAARL